MGSKKSHLKSIAAVTVCSAVCTVTSADAAAGLALGRNGGRGKAGGHACFGGDDCWGVCEQESGNERVGEPGECGTAKCVGRN